jgi:hypothetical protein
MTSCARARAATLIQISAGTPGIADSVGRIGWAGTRCHAAQGTMQTACCDAPSGRAVPR